MVTFPSVLMDLTLTPDLQRLGCSASNGFWDFHRTWQFLDHFSFEHRTILAIDRAQEPKLSHPPRVFRALKRSYARPWVLEAELLMDDLLGLRTTQRHFLQSHYFDTFLFSFLENKILFLCFTAEIKSDCNRGHPLSLG